MTEPRLAAPIAGLPPGAPVLSAIGLMKQYLRRSTVGRTAHRAVVHAVDDVSLALYAGRVTALIGESGSGKSTVSRLLSLLEWPTSGTVTLNGEVVVSGQASPLRRSRLLREHSADVQLIFQDPFSSLNGNHTVGYHLERPLHIHRRKLGKTADIDSQVVDLLEQVNLRPGASYAVKYPHELSGGQRQRVAIARALACEPAVLLADEPVSMLDVSVRLGILALLDEVRRRRNLAVLYITHDVASAGYFADEALVMYAGQLIEGGPAQAVFRQPAHPSTRLLIEAAPDPGRRRTEQLGDVGEPPSLVSPPSGCRFHPRCAHAMAICSQERPEPIEVAVGHWAKCWLYGPSGGTSTPAAALATPTGPAERPSSTSARVG
jgi:peptide/nickel transport system ATP-binding protein